MNNSTIDEPVIENSSPFAELPLRSLIGVVITGLATGLIIFILGHMLDNYIVGPALCRGASDAACVSSDLVSFHIAAVVSALLGVVMLVNNLVYRPLLVAIAVVISTWQFHTLLLALTWYWMLLAFILLNIVSYLVFTWILRIYNFAISLAITILVIASVLFVSSL